MNTLVPITGAGAVRYCVLPSNPPAHACPKVPPIIPVFVVGRYTLPFDTVSALVVLLKVKLALPFGLLASLNII